MQRSFTPSTYNSQLVHDEDPFRGFGQTRRVRQSYFLLPLALGMDQQSKGSEIGAYLKFLAILETFCTRHKAGEKDSGLWSCGPQTPWQIRGEAGLRSLKRDGQNARSRQGQGQTHLAAIPGGSIETHGCF